MNELFEDMRKFAGLNEAVAAPVNPQIAAKTSQVVQGNRAQAANITNNEMAIASFQRYLSTIGISGSKKELVIENEALIKELLLALTRTADRTLVEKIRSILKAPTAV
jgi:hypothetical protein